MVSRVSKALFTVWAFGGALLSGVSRAAPPAPPAPLPVIISSEHRQVIPPDNCPDLPPLGDERLILYGTYEGAALSTTAVGDRDKEFTVADVIIEKGKEPLYIILSSADAVIWRFTGAVRRISKLYVSTRQKLPADIPAAGVVGVKRDKITFGYCLRAFSGMESIAGARSRGDVRRMLGREPRDTGGRYSTAVVSFPSMAELPAPVEQKAVPPGFDKNLWRDVLNFWSSGLAHIDPKSVVGLEKPVAYDVLPSQGGLAQLTGMGSLIRLQDSNEFKIVRPIARFPAGMGGAHSAKFLLGKGIPYPSGDPVHSCVVSEESGEVLSQHPILCGP